jgi:putative tricarboxylic transport membrane protein
MQEETLLRMHSRIVELCWNLARQRDFYAGGLMILFGLVMAVKGSGYGLGSLMHIGPGFFPTMLGVILIVLGIGIAGSAGAGAADEMEEDFGEDPEWRGWACILAGPLMFILFGSLGGLIPGTFACVFVSALGDRTMTLKRAVVLAAVVTVFGVALFSYVLHVPMPLLGWGSA